MITRGTVDGHQLTNTPVLLSTGDTEMDVTAKMCLFSTPGQIASQRKSAQVRQRDYPSESSGICIDR